MEDLLRSLWAVFWGEFEKLPPNFSEVVLMWKSPDEADVRATS